MSTEQSRSLADRDGIPYGEVYDCIREDLASSAGQNIHEEGPPKWDQPGLVRMFRRLGTVPSSHSAPRAALRILLAANEMASDNGVSPPTVYADLVRFTHEDGGTCVDPPRCSVCPVREYCEHAKRGPRMKDLPRAERPRERLLARGPAELTTAELLAIQIGGGNKETTALDLAQQLLATFGSLRGVADAGNEELKTIRGIGDARLARILSGLELGRRLAGEPLETGMSIKGSKQVFKHFHERLKDRKREVFLSLMLDTRHRVIREDQVAVGSLNESVVHPREVFKNALKESAHAVLFVHNHPSGDPSPSPQDRQLTTRLTEAGRLMGIKVLDHMIVGRDKYFSFAEQGELRKSS